MNRSIKTTAYIAGMVLLFLILVTVLGIMCGILPLREQAEAPEATDSPPTVITPTPLADPTPTPTNAHIQVPEMVLDEENQIFAVNVTYSRGGTVTPSGMTTVVKGGVVVLTILPDEGYAVEYVTVNGENVQAEGSLTLRDVDANQSVYVSFIHMAEPTPPVAPVNTPDVNWNPFASPTPPADPEQIPEA